jgi:hypothetical protein
MKDSEAKSPPSKPSLTEDIRRGWDWVVFSVKTLSRIGGIGAWSRTLQRVVGILLDRAIAQQQAARTDLANSIAAVRTSFFAPAKFPFTQDLEANWQAIYRELANLQGDLFIDWSERYLYQEGWTTNVLLHKT